MTGTELEDALHRHFAPARAAQLPAGSWERLEAVLDGERPVVVPINRSPGAHSRGRRWALLAGAVAIVSAWIGAVAVLAPDPGDPGSIAPTATAGRDGSAVATEVVPNVPQPTEVVAVVDQDGDGLGSVVRLGRSVGCCEAEVVEVLVEAPPPSDDAPGHFSAPSSVDLLPDGRIVYGTCCEPAVGQVFITSPDGSGAPRSLGYGDNPAASPDGTQVAVSVQGVGITLIDVVTGDTEAVLDGGEQAATGVDDIVLGLAWSPDGAALAVSWLVHDEKADDWYHAIELLDLESGRRRAVYDEARDGGAAHGVFLADGRIAFVTGVPAVTELGSAALLPVGTGLSVFDPSTGEAEPRFGHLQIASLDATADGQWILATAEGGAVRIYTGTDLQDQGTMFVVAGLVAAGW